MQDPHKGWERRVRDIEGTGESVKWKETQERESNAVKMSNKIKIEKGLLV